MRNTLAAAIKDKIYLPKYIYIVPDDNLIRYAKVAKIDHSQSAMGRMVNNIMSQHNKYIDIQKEHLPKKAYKENFPQIFWIEAPLNDNFYNNDQRVNFNKALNHYAKFNKNKNVLQLKKIWDPQDTTYYVF